MIRPLLLFAALLELTAGELKLSSFELNDQYGHTHRVSFPGDRPVLITIADQKGAAAMDTWIAALKTRYSTNVTYVGIADVRGTPALLRSFVRRQFKKKYAHPVLLDWDGKICAQLAGQPNVPNIYYFRPDGDLTIHKREVYSENGLADLPQASTAARRLNANN